MMLFLLLVVVVVVVCAFCRSLITTLSASKKNKTRKRVQGEAMHRSSQDAALHCMHTNTPRTMAFRKVQPPVAASWPAATVTAAANLGSDVANSVQACHYFEPSESHTSA